MRQHSQARHWIAVAVRRDEEAQSECVYLVVRKMGSMACRHGRVLFSVRTDV